MTNDEDIESLLIVDEGKYSKKNAVAQAKIIINFAKVSKEGRVIILDNNIPPIDKMKISLVVKYIAHTFDGNISESITLRELSEVMSERVESVGSRLSKIIKSDNFAKKCKKGVYKVNYFVIDKFLSSLTEKSNSPDKSIRRRTNKKGRKDKEMTGVGKDIKELLVEQDFFKTPKTMNEICTQLKQEVKFHNPKVVDATIRKTFVESKKILKRIPNENKGKAKWLYVIR